jgi:hypothetical protein
MNRAPGCRPGPASEVAFAFGRRGLCTGRESFVDLAQVGHSRSHAAAVSAVAAHRITFPQMRQYQPDMSLPTHGVANIECMTRHHKLRHWRKTFERLSALDVGLLALIETSAAK